MRPIGFSTGALALDNFTEALRMLSSTSANAVELSALRKDELKPLVRALPQLDLSQFEYKSFHAPSSIEPSFEDTALRLLHDVAELGWHIIVHPNVITTPAKWARLGESLCIENMDKRKPIGQTANDLASIFEVFREASFCFDIGHARQVDPTMSEAAAILHRFAGRLVQLHMSEVNSQSKHDGLTLESIIAFSKVSQLIPDGIPIILESRVSESEIQDELDCALRVLNRDEILAVAGD
jgi:hypothetical protein